MSSFNYAARDEAVRHNVYASVRRRDGLPHAAFAHYWRDVHATLCARLPGLGFYVQQHFARDGGANLWPVADGLRRIDCRAGWISRTWFCVARRSGGLRGRRNNSIRGRSEFIR